jgi:hypothetical protein
VQRFFVTDLKGFLGTSGIVFGTLGSLCALTLGFAAIVDEEDKEEISMAGERLLYSTVLFILASLCGVFAIQVIEADNFGKNMDKVFNLILSGFGFLFLIMSFYMVQQGVGWLMDALYRRFNVWQKSYELALKNKRRALRQSTNQKMEPLSVDIKIEEKVIK